jgi:nitroimidazol reductase NimA-like FMN-containing flavoprotein (pyridoxamine 5'-phosphate oxidase superfamily)
LKNKAITEKKEILDIIKRSQWCHLAMTDAAGKPYVIPLNFGFREDVIYMHGAQEGKKIEALKKNPEVCVNFSIDHLLRYQSEQVACSWSMKYRSVLCYGRAEFIEDPEEKTAALHVIMAQYSGNTFTFNPPSIREVRVWKVPVEKFEGRVYGY